MNDNRIKNTKECSLDKQSHYKNYNISNVNSISALKECLLKVIDDLTSDIMFDIIGIDYLSIKLDISNHCLESDTDISYLRSETDLEYEARLESNIKMEENALLVVKLQAEKLGYKLEKINE